MVKLFLLLAAALALAILRPLPSPAALLQPSEKDFKESGQRCQFAVHGFRPVQAEAATWRRHPYVLDHIYYNEPLKRVSHEVVPTLTSDHHLVVADFEFA